MKKIITLISLRWQKATKKSVRRKSVAIQNQDSAKIRQSPDAASDTKCGTSITQSPNDCKSGKIDHKTNDNTKTNANIPADGHTEADKTQRRREVVSRKSTETFPGKSCPIILAGLNSDFWD